MNTPLDTPVCDPAGNSGGPAAGQAERSDSAMPDAPQHARPNADLMDLGILVRQLEPGSVRTFLLDEQLRFSYLPGDSARLLGGRADDFLGATIWERFPHLAGSPLERLCGEVLATHEERLVGCRVAHLGCWVEVALTWLPAGLAVQIRDVTARREADRRLNSNENLLQAIFDALPLWLSVKDTNFRYLMLNKKELVDTGLKISDYYNTHTLELPLGLHDEMEELLRQDRLVVEQGRPIICDGTLHTLADGSERVMRHHKAPFFGADGEIAGVVTISDDVTAHNQLLADLASSQRRLQMAQELALTGSWEWGVTTGTWSWSEGLHTLLQADPDTVAPSYERMLDYIHPEDRESVVSALDAALSEKMDFDIEHRLLLEDNSVRAVRHRAKVFVEEGAGDWRILGSLLDVSDYKRVERQLRTNAARLARSNHDLEAFATVASHDLQEPLRKILAFGERLDRAVGESLAAEPREHLKRVLSSTQRMRGLIDDLLQYSRIATRARPLVPTDLNEVVQEVRQMLERQIAASGARIQVGPLPTLEADAAQLSQLFQHLIGNALKFTRSGVVPEVSIHEGEPDSDPRDGPPGEVRTRCTIHVTDNGIGFEQKFAERIFGMFQKLHGRASAYPGTGIGLALCRKIVDRHGGVISARGIPGQGAEITVRLPIAHHDD